MSDSEEETKDKQLKIAILGDGSAGKVRIIITGNLVTLGMLLHYIVFHNNW